MTPIKIIAATVNDVELLVELSRSTFYESFASQNTEENMKKFVDKNFTTENIRKEFTAPGVVFFLAYVDNTPAGYMKLGTGGLPTEANDVASVEIERIYVKQMFQHQKVGKAFMEKACEFAKVQDCKCIRLGVWEKNVKAIAFYHRWGFEEYGHHIFMVGEDPQNDLLMVKHL